VADLMTWTPHPELNAVLQLLLDGSERVLGTDFLGMYLHGSLAAGDFDAQRSDVDFVVILHSAVTDVQLPELKQLFDLLVLADPSWAVRLEGCFMPQAAFRDVREQGAFPSYDEGQFLIDHKGINNAIQRHVLREHGIVLAGPAPRTFIDPVSPDELKAESMWLLHNWWKPQLTKQENLRDRVYQAYGVLTMCRIAYTLSSGLITSKPRAAAWMRAQYPQWTGLIDRALAWRSDDGVDDLDETLRFISCVVEAQNHQIN
jgi:hypothetical protein